MYPESSMARKALVIFTLALGGFTTPVFAGETTDCFWEVMHRCDDALEEASWWEKPAVGFFCSGMLAGCAFESI